MTLSCVHELICRAEPNLHGYINELEHNDYLFKSLGDLVLIFKVGFDG